MSTQHKFTLIQLSALSLLLAAPNNTLPGRSGWANGKTVAWLIRSGNAVYDSKLNQTTLTVQGKAIIEGKSIPIPSIETVNPTRPFIAELTRVMEMASQALNQAKSLHKAVYGS